MHRQNIQMESSIFLQSFELPPPSPSETISAQRVSANAGETLLHQGESCTHFMYVERGLVKVEKLSASGHEIMLYHLGPGQACELATACLLAGHHYPATALAEQDSSVLLINKGEFLKLFKGTPTFQQYIFRDLDNTTAHLLDLLEDVVAIPMEQRLARFLYQHSKKNNPIATTHQQIAIELGSAREVISRLLKKFELQHWIQRSRGLIWISSPSALKKLAENNAWVTLSPNNP